MPARSPTRADRMRFELDLAGRHAVVFGGTTGINLGIAEAFVCEGLHVTVASRQRGNVDAALARLRRLGPDVSGCVADVREPAAVDAALAEATAQHGPIDVLVS